MILIHTHTGCIRMSPNADSNYCHLSETWPFKRRQTILTFSHLPYWAYWQLGVQLWSGRSRAALLSDAELFLPAARLVCWAPFRHTTAALQETKEGRKDQLRPFFEEAHWTYSFQTLLCRCCECIKLPPAAVRALHSSLSSLWFYLYTYVR